MMTVQSGKAGFQKWYHDVCTRIWENC